MTGQPNIVFVFFDNLGYGELGCYGGGVVRGAPTPRIDQFASEGMRLTNMNMEAQCTPSRSAVMTGRIPVRSGTTRIPQPAQPSGLVTWERTIAQLLKTQDYATGHFGKWHLGDTVERQPNARGFDEWWGLLETHDSSFWSEASDFAESGVPSAHIFEGQAGSPSQPITAYDTEQRRVFDQNCFSRAEDFIRRCTSAETPFFCYLPIAFPHFPTLPHPDFVGATGNGDFADAFVEIDTRIGALLDLLDELEASDDTVVIITSDNGAEDVLPWRGWSGPWGGSYFTAMEGSLRVPFMVRWPGHIEPGGVSNEMCHAVDLFTTMASFAGAAIPEDRPIDGLDLVPFFTGERNESGREAILCFVADRLHAIKWRNWKLHFIWQEYMLDPPVELSIPRAFNLFDDPRERHDIFLPDNTWVHGAANPFLQEFRSSLVDHPAIEPGTPDPFEPQQH
ncbi:MAG: sulfatase-like hydrolase/transferase [Acidimicrobiales bacterium]|jgi:arylsulfatase A-like enzyme